MKQANSEKEALQQLKKHTANYAHRITKRRPGKPTISIVGGVNVYKKDGKAVKREVAEYDQREKEWLD